MNGATLHGRECLFRAWAPATQSVRLRRVSGASAGEEYAMHREPDGHFSWRQAAAAGDRYFYVVDGGQPVPDPVSRALPLGIHGPTEIVDPAAFRWSDARWKGLDLRDYIIYELHVGTFSPQGTFDGVIPRLDYLKNKLGISVIELMPVATFPGERNWGYDGVSAYAVQHSYGGPEGLKRLVDAAHGAGLGVLLDVVYNHLGNEGNYLRHFGPYFTDRYRTPWGDAINYDGEGSEGVRRYVVENALYWVEEYHLDGLRLDAVQTIYDNSENRGGQHILAEIQQAVQRAAGKLGRRICVIAETDANDVRLLRPGDHPNKPKAGLLGAPGEGYGLDGVWSDDFHHAVHVALTGERRGYYQDFGRPGQIARALEEGFIFQGEHFNFWGKPRGTRPQGVPLWRHVICIQNHDQVGNRAQGERLTALASRGARRMAAALLLLAPHTPLLFMGQEYDETNPFQFFTSYGDSQLAQAVTRGRREEFKDFSWEDIPDPQDPATFERSRLNWNLVSDENDMLAWYRDLLALRRRLVSTGQRTAKVEERDGVVSMQVPALRPRLMLLAAVRPQAALPRPTREWREALSCSEDGYGVKVLVTAKDN